MNKHIILKYNFFIIYYEIPLFAFVKKYSVWEDNQSINIGFG
jgi:hypothetical protein